MNEFRFRTIYSLHFSPPDKAKFNLPLAIAPRAYDISPATPHVPFWSETSDRRHCSGNPLMWSLDVAKSPTGVTIKRKTENEFKLDSTLAEFVLLLINSQKCFNL